MEARAPVRQLADAGVGAGAGPAVSGAGTAPLRRSETAGLDPAERAADREITLLTHLERQLAATRLAPAQRRIVARLVEEVEPDGYLRADLAEIAANLGAPLADVEAALRVAQGFEPAGVMARDLAECLALQLADRGRLDPWMQALLARLDMVARGDRQGLRAAIGCSKDDLDDMLAELRGLTPRPGAGFGETVVCVVTPEVRVRRGDDGAWIIEPFAPNLPEPVVREDRFRRFEAGARSEEDRAWLRERLASARRFAELVARRGRTILDIAGEIVRRQEGFFEDGLPGMRPLMMRTVAETLGMHESTVSRAVADKAMVTPHGTIPFRAFFPQATITAAGADLTHDHLLGRIRSLIAHEGRRILSDEAIADRLAGEGIVIARRTVAKHREGMGIPTSALRKRAVRG
jgi:RNA polymerase sigma-54 factor